MTKSRSEKSSQTEMLRKIQSGHQEPAHSPKLRAAMIKDHGAPTYSPTEWIKNRMGRGANGSGDLRGDRAVAKIKANRMITRKG